MEIPVPILPLWAGGLPFPQRDCAGLNCRIKQTPARGETNGGRRLKDPSRLVIMRHDLVASNFVPRLFADLRGRAVAADI